MFFTQRPSSKFFNGWDSQGAALSRRWEPQQLHRSTHKLCCRRLGSTGEHWGALLALSTCGSCTEGSFFRDQASNA